MACNELEEITEFNLRASIIVLLPCLWHDAGIPAQAHGQYCTAAA
jgi:hypothetical protein